MAAVQVQHSPPVEAPQSYIKAKKPCCSRKRQRVEERVRPAAEPAAFLMSKKIQTLLEKLTLMKKHDLVVCTFQNAAKIVF